MDQSFIFLATNNPANWRALMYETTAPNTPVAFIDVPASHTSSQTITFTNLNDVAHFFRVYELLAGDALGQLLADDIVQPQPKSLSAQKPLPLTVGVEITTGSDVYDGSTDHPELIGMVAGVDYRIEERAIGTLRPEEFEDIGQPGFGFKVKNGKTFEENDTYFLHFLAKLISVASTPAATSGKMFSDIVEITADTSLDSTYMGKLIDANATGTTLVITLDLLASFLDNALIGFKQHRGNQINTVIKARSTETIYFRGEEVNEVIIAKGEHVYLSKKSGKWHVIEDNISKEVGLPVMAYSQLLNTVVADGSPLNRADYPRLWAYVNSIGALVSETVWNTTNIFLPGVINNKTNFSSGDGSTTFRVPDLRDLFFRSAAATRTPGSYQYQQVGRHNHRMPVWADSPGLAFGTEEIAARNLEDFTTSATSKTTVHTTDYNTTDTTNETRPKNVGLLPLIKI